MRSVLVIRGALTFAGEGSDGSGSSTLSHAVGWPVRRGCHLYHLRRTSCKDAVRHGSGRNRVWSQLQEGDYHASTVGGSRLSEWYCGMVDRVAFPLGRRWCPPRCSDPPHADRDCADEQAVARSCLGQGLAPRQAASPSLGHAAYLTNDFERRCLCNVSDPEEPLSHGNVWRKRFEAAL